MKIILVDRAPKKYYPITLTRSLADVLVGCTRLKDKWLRFTKDVDIEAEDHLQDFYPKLETKEAVFVDSSVLPTTEIVKRLKELSKGEGLEIEGFKIAHASDSSLLEGITWAEYKGFFSRIEALTDLFLKNQQWIADDLDYLPDTINKASEFPQGVTVTGNSLYLGKDVKLEPCIINTKAGPVIIDSGAEVMEGCMLRGPLYIGKNAVIKMGAKIYGPSSFGPECRIGGEVNNSVMLGYSNKGHDGFLGNSILGEWCNLGADSNNSNLKNNYGIVKRWCYESGDFKATGLQFCGLIMGDHSKCAINTMFNTGSTVGVNSNVFTSKFPPKYVPSFAWLGDNKSQRYEIEKSKEVAKEVMKRRKVEFTAAHSALFEAIYKMAI